MFKDFNEYLNWATGHILCGLLEGGGKGLRGALIGCINAYANWQEEEKKKKKNP